jgi:nitrous oxide reductase accessory protein NosL
LKDDLNDHFVFCQAIREAYGVRIAHELQLITASIRYRMKKGGEITGFEAVTKPYVLRDGAAKAFNESRKHLSSPPPFFPSFSRPQYSY